MGWFCLCPLFYPVCIHAHCSVIIVSLRSLHVSLSQWWGSTSGLPGPAASWTSATSGSTSSLGWLHSTLSHHSGSSAYPLETLCTSVDLRPFWVTWLPRSVGYTRVSSCHTSAADLRAIRFPPALHPFGYSLLGPPSLSTSSHGCILCPLDPHCHLGRSSLRLKVSLHLFTSSAGSNSIVAIFGRPGSSL